MYEIIRATSEHIPQIAPLLDEYRIFYGQVSDIAAARHFLEQRLLNGESVIFLAYHKEKPVGFTQLYTSYSSVSLQPVYILNDLFVQSKVRGHGIGAALLNRAKECCRASKHKGLLLETAIDNPAQRLYEKLGWAKDTACFHYFWSCD
ncbi:MAG: GNAT family N-acetyltransferase [Maribacter sp.]